MKKDHSDFIRNQGDRLAFDHGQWEFQSRQLAFSANHLLSDHVEMIKRKEYEGVALLPTSQFLVSLAIELISKAYYLKIGTGHREVIYKHEVLSLCEGITLSQRQRELMHIAESNVLWAGRYPTPKWTKEVFKEDYDVPCQIIDGKVHVEADKMKNSSSPDKVEELLELYSFLRDAWQKD